jgi:hypothetical protein
MEIDLDFSTILLLIRWPELKALLQLAFRPSQKFRILRLHSS